MEKKIIALDATILNTLQMCGRKFKYAHIDNLKPLTTPTYFDKGSLFHNMLQLYYTFRKHRPNKPIDEVVKLCIRKGERLALRLDLPTEDCLNVIEYFRFYCARYSNDNWRIVHVEKPFANILYDSEEVMILYQGKPDLAIFMQNFEPLVVIDHKTGSRDQDPSVLSNQFFGYCWALDTNVVVINKINFYKKLDPEKSFKRYTKNYPKGLIEEWKDEAIYWALVGNQYIDSNHFPANYTSCDKYGSCVFAKTSNGSPGVCEIEPGAREFKIRSEYKVGEEWDVGKRLRGV